MSLTSHRTHETCVPTLNYRKCKYATHKKVKPYTTSHCRDTACRVRSNVRLKKKHNFLSLTSHRTHETCVPTLNYRKCKYATHKKVKPYTTSHCRDTACRVRSNVRLKKKHNFLSLTSHRTHETCVPTLNYRKCKYATHKKVKPHTTSHCRDTACRVRSNVKLIKT